MEWTRKDSSNLGHHHHPQIFQVALGDGAQIPVIAEEGLLRGRMELHVAGTRLEAIGMLTMVQEVEIVMIDGVISLVKTILIVMKEKGNQG